MMACVMTALDRPYSGWQRRKDSRKLLMVFMSCGTVIMDNVEAMATVISVSIKLKPRFFVRNEITSNFLKIIGVG